ncbi:MAG TPA: ribonucleotide reductase N-terminal alpha domain-containing protein, partial [Candidatus Dojkabacteria bacterium]|nr:ribonucleotide reductase N-terminal alpha domain-containing protein [Candidatus Dojkabacteria bacterium]
MNLNDPYDSIKFEIKHVKIVGANGNIIFEDHVEFPKDFDDSAAAVVASRYLCNDAKNKETSIKQMFNRVSDTISNWGADQGYFIKKYDNGEDPDSEMEYFNYKLKCYQINKYFAFNSPVYFNCGLQES